MITSIFKEESGQGMVEYGLILVLISLAVVGALGGLGGGPIKRMYNDGGQEVLDALNEN